MKLNLTKLLNVNKNFYTGKYGETSWIGNLLTATNMETDYSFDIEEEA